MHGNKGDAHAGNCQLLPVFHTLQRLRSDDSTGQATAVQNMLTRRSLGLRFDYTSCDRDPLVSMWAQDGHAARAS
jgi:hypothetical protein